MSHELKAFQCSDCDWYAAKDATHASDLHFDLCGELPEDPYPVEVSDEELDREVPDFNEDGEPTGEMTTMRRWLAEIEGPGWLCGTE